MCRDINITLNKDKSIGRVLYIVEGEKTEHYILRKLFSRVFDYQVEELPRNGKYRKYNSKTNPNSKVFVINAEQSNIKNIDKNDKFLDKMFTELIENYDFDIDNSAIYYLFDRDSKSNTDADFIAGLIKQLANSRYNDGYLRQGLLLLSYPSVEGFTLSNFCSSSFLHTADTGANLKSYLHTAGINHQKITEKTLIFAVKELMDSFAHMNIDNYDIDNFGACNMDIFKFEEDFYRKENLYHVLSLICISFIDLGLIEAEWKQE